MGNVEAKKNASGEKPNEENKGGAAVESRDMLNQLVESDLSYKIVKERSEQKRSPKRDSSTGLRKKVPQYIDDNKNTASTSSLHKARNVRTEANQKEGSNSPSRPGQNVLTHSPKDVSQYAATMLKSGRLRTSPKKVNRQNSHLAENIITQEEKLERRREMLEKRKKAVLLQTSSNYSNSNLLDIKTLLNRETLSSMDPNQILFEGELLKYKPGTSFNWVERWCRVTRSAFMYYKNEWTSNCWDLKPLAIIPIREIVAVFRVNLDLPNHKTQQPLKQDLASAKAKFKELFQFEIFSELTDYPYKDEIPEEESDEALADDKKQQQHQHHQQKFPIDNEEKKIAQQIDVSKLEGFKLWDEYQEKKQRESPANAKRKGYLMRPPMTHKTYKTSRDNFQKTREAANREYLEVAYGVQHHLAKTNSPLKSRQAAITDQYASPLKRKVSPDHKSSPARLGAAYKWVKDSGDLTSWSGREREWFYSEKRLLFACPNQKERETWVAVLNWVFEKMMAEEYDGQINTVEEN